MLQRSLFQPLHEHRHPDPENDTVVSERSKVGKFIVSCKGFGKISFVVQATHKAFYQSACKKTKFLNVIIQPV